MVIGYNFGRVVAVVGYTCGMSGYYNIIKHISIGLRPFGLKFVFICYINYLRKLSKVKVFIFPTATLCKKLNVFLGAVENEAKALEEGLLFARDVGIKDLIIGEETPKYLLTLCLR